jgi:DNA processing protein
MNNTLPYWLAALRIKNIGPLRLFAMLSHFPTIEHLFKASPDAWKAAGISSTFFTDLQQPDWKWVEQEMKWMNGKDHHLICYDDDRYPYRLKEIADPPLVLYLKGDPAGLCLPQLAMVGSRHATQAGIAIANEFAETLAAAGLVITSGLARGIDAAAHRGALKAKGITLGVAGTGLHYVYPTMHRRLADDMVAAGGALISEFPLATPAHAAHFPRRNRIIAGLSCGVLVVEAALQSGSLITARLAIEAGREVFAIPGAIHQPLARGCHHLIRQGAKLVETVEDILEEFVGNGSLKPLTSLAQVNDNFKDLPEAARQVLTQIDIGVTPLDVIISRSGLTSTLVSSMLLSLELYGCILSVPGGYIRTAGGF